MARYDRPLTLEQIAAIQDEDIDFSDIPELDEDFWQDAKLVEPDRTEQITLRVKGSVLAYFKATGKGYQSRINRVLESYVQRARSRAGRELQKDLKQSPAAKTAEETLKAWAQSPAAKAIEQFQQNSAFKEFERIQRDLEQSPAIKAIEQFQRNLEQFQQNSAFKEFERIQRDLEQSPAIKAIEQFQQNLEQFQQNSAFKEFERIQRDLEQSPAIKAIEQFQQNLEQFQQNPGAQCDCGDCGVSGGLEGERSGQDEAGPGDARRR